MDTEPGHMMAAVVGVTGRGVWSRGPRDGVWRGA